MGGHGPLKLPSCQNKTEKKFGFLFVKKDGS